MPGTSDDQLKFVPGSRLYEPDLMTGWRWVEELVSDELFSQLVRPMTREDFDMSTTSLSWRLMDWYPANALMRIHDKYWDDVDRVLYFVNDQRHLFAFRGSMDSIYEINFGIYFM